MKQATLFDEPKIVFTDLTKIEHKDLKDIVLEACENGLLFGEPESHSSADRQKIIRSYFPRAYTHYDYYIKCGNKVIGYVSIDDGWIASEMGCAPPKAEMGFLHPDYARYATMVRSKVHDILKVIKENPE